MNEQQMESHHHQHQQDNDNEKQQEQEQDEINDESKEQSNHDLYQHNIKNESQITNETESELAVNSIPSGFVRCEDCNAIVSKPLLAKHEQTYCSAALAQCSFSKESGDMCKLSLETNADDNDELEFTRAEISTHIENNVGMHLLYVMQLVEQQSIQIASLQSELSSERALRIAMESQLKDVVTKLAQKVDHADVATFSTPSVSRTASGRTIERRQAQPSVRLHRSPARSVETTFVEPLPVSTSGWKPKRAANNDESVDTFESLAKKLHSTLNKLTPTNYPKLSASILDLLKSVTDSDTLSTLTERLFEKGLEDSFYAWMYADLCSLLVTELPIIDNDKSKSFRVFLITLCQKEFEKGADAAKVSDDSFDKTRQISSIRFIGELFCRSLISIKVMIACLEQMSAEIINSRSEVFVEGLCQLLMTVGPKLDSLPDDSNRIAQFFTILTQTTENDSQFSSRSRFLWLDVIERRSVGWKKRANMKEDRASSTVLQPKHNTPSLEDDHKQHRPRVTFHDDYYNQQSHHSQQQNHQHIPKPRVDTDAMQELTFEQRRMQSDAMSHAVKKWSPFKKALKTPT